MIGRRGFTLRSSCAGQMENLHWREGGERSGMVGRRGGFFFSSPDRLTTHSRRGAFDRRSRRFLEGLVEWNREFRCMYGVKEQEREEKKKKRPAHRDDSASLRESRVRMHLSGMYILPCLCRRIVPPGGTLAGAPCNKPLIGMLPGQV